ncbi:MAG: flagellar hook-length control protein FliK [Hyphomonadaceae bacterium]|nr:flagellar hook-length control protein FliK [Hyphomonadaceae bacterium]
MNGAIERDTFILPSLPSRDGTSTSLSSRKDGDAFRARLTESDRDERAPEVEDSNTAPNTGETPLPAWAEPPARSDVKPAVATAHTSEHALPGEIADTAEERAQIVDAGPTADLTAADSPAEADAETMDEMRIKAPDAPTPAQAAQPEDTEMASAAATPKSGAPAAEAIAKGTPDKRGTTSEASRTSLASKVAGLSSIPDTLGKTGQQTPADPTQTIPAEARTETAPGDWPVPDLSAPSADDVIQPTGAKDLTAALESAGSTSNSPSTSSSPMLVAGTVAAPTAPTSLAPAMAPTHALITASPAEVVSIINQSISNADEPQDRIMVQLDPPELGRVSIDFKFDAQGLQHVTITGETPEALRQLRSMHFELIQALERQGLSSQDMSFRQQSMFGQNGQGQQQGFAQNAADPALETASTAPQAAARTITSKAQPPSGPGGLNLRL